MTTGTSTHRSAWDLREKVAEVWAQMAASGDRLVDSVLDTLRGHRYRLVPSGDAGTARLAAHPHMTVQLSAEQTAALLEAEQGAQTLESESPTAAGC